MAIIGMRDLLRDPKQVFRDVEERGEPMVVTRNGRPVAALVPVDSENAERLLLGATPEYSASRRQAALARAEGRTESLDDAIAEYNARADTTEPIELDDESELTGLSSFLRKNRTFFVEQPAVALVRTVFGLTLATHVATEAALRVAKINERAITAASDAGVPDAESDAAPGLISTIQEGNEQLFGRVLFESLRETLATRLLVAHDNAESATRLSEAEPKTFAQEVVDVTLDHATLRVEMLNGAALRLGTQFGKGQLSLQTYGAIVQGADLFERTTEAGLAGPSAYELAEYKLRS